MQLDAVEAGLRSADESSRRQFLKSFVPTEDQQLLNRVATYLSDPSPAVCEAAAEALVRCQNSAAARATALRLQSDDPRERGYAASTLVRLGPHAAPIVVELLKTSDRDLRRYAAEVLAAIGSKDAICALTAALADSDVNVAAAAAEALGDLRNPDAVPALAEAVEKGPDWLCYTAITSLGSVGGPAAAKAICSTPKTRPGFVLAAAASALQRIGWVQADECRHFLMALLRSGERGVREAALVATARMVDVDWQLKTDEAAALNDAALEATTSLSPEARAAAASCIGVLGCCDRRILLDLAEDPEGVVRTAALRAQVKLGVLEPVDLLNLAAKREEAVDARLMALRTLRELYLPAITELDDVLVSIVGEDDAHPVRAAALALLLAKRSPLVLPAATSFAAEEGILDDEAVVAELSACSISDLLPVVSHLLKKCNDARTRVAAIRALLPADRAGEIGTSPTARGVLLTAACHPDWPVRAHAFHLLSACGAEWARCTIREGCLDNEPRVRVRAIQALSQLGVLPEEVPMLERQLRDTSGWIRAQCVSALAQNGFIDESIVTRALEDEFPPVRRAGLSAALHLAGQCHSTEFAATARRAVFEAENADDEEMRRLGQELARSLGLC